MTTPNWVEIRKGLGKPFTPDKIKRFAGAEIKQGANAGKCLWFPYVDARDVFDRLDEVVGPENWSDASSIVDATTKAVACTLSLFGVSKTDVGYPNAAADAGNAQMEPLKAAYSDAVKRAAVRWGVGRHLYDMTPIMLPRGQRPKSAAAAANGDEGASPPAQPAQPRAQPSPPKAGPQAQTHAEPDDPKPVSPEREQLLDEATEALRKLSELRGTSGAKILAECRKERLIESVSFNDLPDVDLATVRDWAQTEMGSSEAEQRLVKAEATKPAGAVPAHAGEVSV